MYRSPNKKQRRSPPSIPPVKLQEQPDAELMRQLKAALDPYWAARSAYRPPAPSEKLAA